MFVYMPTSVRGNQRTGKEQKGINTGAGTTLFLCKKMIRLLSAVHDSDSSCHGSSSLALSRQTMVPSAFGFNLERGRFPKWAETRQNGCWKRHSPFPRIHLGMPLPRSRCLLPDSRRLLAADFCWCRRFVRGLLLAGGCGYRLEGFEWLVPASPNGF